jgi:predicted RNA binding protein YcfA (HicA-like mRNA interferase family)
MRPDAGPALREDIVKALGKVGGELERVTGSHHVMRHAGGRHVSVPVHGVRPLPVGTLASICRQVGRSADELRDLFKESGKVCPYRLHGGSRLHAYI